LAQRISSINSLTGLTEKINNCSIAEVKQIVQSDQRIGDSFLNYGPGFGGSCFDKDLKSLIFILDQNGEKVSAQYWQGVLDVNNY
jgi:UDPglucose 6-dehydrogenase